MPIEPGTPLPELKAAKACPNPWCEAPERKGDFTPAVRLHHFGNYRVVCRSCLIEGPPRQTPNDAVDAWNTRTPDPELLAAVREAREALDEVAVDVPDFGTTPGEPSHTRTVHAWKAGRFTDAQRLVRFALTRLDAILAEQGNPHA